MKPVFEYQRLISEYKAALLYSYIILHTYVCVYPSYLNIAGMHKCRPDVQTDVKNVK